MQAEIEQEPAPTTTKDVKVAMDSSELPKRAKLAHVLSVVVAGVIALAVSAVLADGTSVIRLKHAKYLPRATNYDLKKEGLDYRLDELLGPTYGIGLHHDQAGFTWTAIGAEATLKTLLDNLGTPAVIAAVPHVISADSLKHPVPFLSCDDLQMAGLAAMSFGFIAMAVAVLMLIFHLLVLVRMIPSKCAKPIASLVWLVLFAGFLIVICLAVGVYNATWTCNQPVIPSIKLSDHFEYNYGFAFAIIGCLSALLVCVVNICATTMKDGAADAPTLALGAVLTKITAGVVVGIVVAAVAGVVVMSANKGFDPKPKADPNKNPCEGQKPYHAGPGDNYFSNTACFKDSVTQTLEQAGGNVTKGFKGLMDAGDRVPITKEYSEEGLCPVNVHWHLGAEHLSVGQYDEAGKGPARRRELAATGTERLGGRCHLYDANKASFTTPYNFQYCTNMQVGETYEIHWPHSAAGACGTDWQYQTPFYDGVFCNDGIISIAPLNTYKKIGVQSQVFTVVNDEDYYYGDLISGAIMKDDKWQDVARYTGSTTGTSRDNTMCSRYTPITWQVDRKCHLISASSFDKLCKDMKGMKDDMKGDFYPHGSRKVVDPKLTANNQQTVFNSLS